MKILNDKKGVLFLGILVVVVAAGWYFMFVNIKGLNENISLLLQQSKLEEKKAAAIHSIEIVVNDSNSDIDKLNSYFIDKDGAAAFIESIESLGRKNGVAVSIDSVDIAGNGAATPPTQKQNKAGGSNTELLKLTISARGSWQKVFHFLSLLENMPFKLAISEANLTAVSSEAVSTEKGAAVTSWNGKFSIEVLKLK